MDTRLSSQMFKNMGLLTWKQTRKGVEMCKLITWPYMSACFVVVPLDVSSTVMLFCWGNVFGLNEVGCELGRPLL